MNSLDGCCNCRDGCVVCGSDFKSRLKEAERELEIVSEALEACKSMLVAQEIRQERYDNDSQYIKKELLQALKDCKNSFVFYNLEREAEFCQKVIERFN